MRTTHATPARLVARAARGAVLAVIALGASTLLLTGTAFADEDSDDSDAGVSQEDVPFGCVGGSSCNGKPVPTTPQSDPCPGGGIKTGIAPFDAVGKAGSDLGQQMCKSAHGTD